MAFIYAVVTIFSCSAANDLLFLLPKKKNRTMDDVQKANNCFNIHTIVRNLYRVSYPRFNPANCDAYEQERNTGFV
jgi:hypothetical protein